MQKEIERKSLNVNFIINFIVALSGIIAYFMTEIQALLLDGFFSFISFLSAIIGIYVSRISHKKTDIYPNGLHFLEPLYAIFKSILILFLFLIAFINATDNALQYVLKGEGEPLDIGPIVPYTIFVVVLCFALSLYTHYQNKKINHISTILSVEAKGSLIDGLQSLGAGLAFCLLYLIDIQGPLGFLHYTGDFFITTISVILLLKEPIQMLRSSFIELSQGLVTDEDITEPIDELIVKHFYPILPDMHYQVIKIGMAIKVRLYVQKNELNYVKDLLDVKQEFLNDLQTLYQTARLEIIHI
ncbi:cation transporter [Granulicatella sp. zg-ZJ]|uniref:cation transporter n=1 Tax=Granulicatella sp. zg-ZJ TaxID=2678504 RepID=UPI0013D0E890|nr:cation transporter [Granulicatella sp. zg-ZJ]NEW61859.1 cation transporter [Granulicatella sp. zg-ZJ]